MPEDELQVVAILKRVEFQGPDEDTITTDVRVLLYVDEDDSNHVHRQLEFKYKHSCGVDNWLLVGTDPGEYRCIGCVDWL
jgi:hypothetical protein